MIPEYRDRYRQWVADTGAENVGHYRERGRLHRMVMEAVADKAIVFLEFGVRKGNSFRWWTNGHGGSESRFVGFDSFVGLPEAWDGSDKHYPAGSLSMHGRLPDVRDARASFVKGWFEDTLPGFFASFDRTNQTLVLHLDCDLYSSSRTVFESAAPHVQVGDYLIMDEAGTGDEFKAYLESGLEARPMAHAGSAVATIITADLSSP